MPVHGDGLAGGENRQHGFHVGVEAPGGEALPALPGEDGGRDAHLPDGQPHGYRESRSPVQRRAAGLAHLDLEESGRPRDRRLGDALRPGDEPLRFAQEPSLIFAPAAIAEVSRPNCLESPSKTVSDIVLELEPGVRLTGRVTGPTGSGLADATVSVQPSPTGSFAMTGSLRRTTTDANGDYVLDGLDPGDETIMVSHPKYNDTSKNVTLKGREAKLDVQLEGGQTITGIVVTDSGAPVAEAEVEAFSAGGGRSSARTNASGQFEMEGMRAGRYRFTASKSGFLEGRVDDLEISAGSPVRITLKTGGSIYGRVTGVSESDMANVTVTARSARKCRASRGLGSRGSKNRIKKRSREGPGEVPMGPGRVGGHQIPLMPWQGPSTPAGCHRPAPYTCSA